MIKKSILFQKKILIAVIIVVLGILLVWLYYTSTINSTSSNKRKSVTIGYGDTFPDIAEFQKPNSNKLSMNEKYNVVLYLSQSCSVCVENLPEYQQLMDEYGKNISFNMLWEDMIPKERIESLKIPLETNFYLNNEYSLSDTYPAYFIMDKNAMIIFFTKDFGSFKNKLKQIGAF